LRCAALKDKTETIVENDKTIEIVSVIDWLYRYWQVLFFFAALQQKFSPSLLPPLAEVYFFCGNAALTPFFVAAFAAMLLDLAVCGGTQAQSRTDLRKGVADSTLNQIDSVLPVFVSISVRLTRKTLCLSEIYL
jgi:hypothetical protein